MKKLLIVLFGAFFLFACAPTEEECFRSDDLSAVELKSKREKVEFTGVCSKDVDYVDLPGIEKLLPNGKMLVKGSTTVWHDDASDWRVTGSTFWYVNQKIEEDGSFKYWGKAELIVDGENEGDPSRGSWDMTWHGYLTFTPMGPQLIAEAVGQGKSGDVKGMVGKWTYIMDFSQFVYNFEGYYK